MGSEFYRDAAIQGATFDSVGDMGEVDRDGATSVAIEAAASTKTKCDCDSDNFRAA